MRKFFIFSAILLLAHFHLNAQGYEIKVKINGISDTTLILGHHFNASMFPDDTIRVNKNGEGVFKGDEKYPGGMYLIFLPTHHYFDFMLDEDQVFKLETDTANLIKNMKVEGNKMNAEFFKYQSYMGAQRKAVQELIEKKKTTEDKDEIEQIDKEIKSINAIIQNHNNSIIEINKDNFFGAFLTALKEVEIPDPPRDEDGNITDSSFQYRYYRNHFFDNFDIADPRLLRTPIYDGKIKQYIEKVVPQVPDTLIKEVDFLIEKSRTSPELFRYMMATLFNYYAKSQIMGMDAVFIYIAEKYYLTESSWSSEEFLEDLKETIKKQKPLLIGKTAPDFQLVNVPAEHFKVAANDTAAKRNPHAGTFFNLYQLKADYIVLYFWEADCGHCKKSTPNLYEVYQNIKNYNAQVVSVHMLGGVEGKEKWVDFINKSELYDWINAWNPYSYEYKIAFDIKTTPVVFVLDKDYKIIAKKVSPEQVEEIIISYAKKEKDSKDPSFLENDTNAAPATSTGNKNE